MPWLSLSDKLIDEGLRTNFACHLYLLMETRLPHAQVIEIVRSAVDVETNYVVQGLPCELIGIDRDMMGEYIRFVADRLLLVLIGRRYYGGGNPFERMGRVEEEEGEVNFYERRV